MKTFYEVLLEKVTPVRTFLDAIVSVIPLTESTVKTDVQINPRTGGAYITFIQLNRDRERVNKFNLVYTTETSSNGTHELSMTNTNGSGSFRANDFVRIEWFMVMTDIAKHLVNIENILDRVTHDYKGVK